MRGKFSKAFFSIGVLSLILQPTLSYAVPNSIDVVNCKLPHVSNTVGFPSLVRIGFPLPQERVQGSGVQRTLFVPIDFPDAPSKETPEGLISKIVQPENARKFYSLQSNGLLTLQNDVHKSVLRMPQKSDEYGNWSKNNDSWALDGPKLDSDIRQALGSFGKNFSYSSVAIVVTGESKAFKSMGASGWALSYGEEGFFFGQPNLKNVMYLVDKDGSSLSDVFIHEFGHLLGFIDLYSTGYLGDSTGPFDVMAYSWERSKSFLGWNLWLKGWIKDTQVVCLNSNALTDSEITLSSLIGNGETRLIVIKESTNSAIVIEARLETEYDQLGENAGLLVYRIRPGAVRPERTVQIIPHKNPSTTKEVSPDFHDVERFRNAPLAEGKYIRERFLLVENQGQSKNEVRTLVSWGLNANTRQRQIDGQSKAAAELKAKQEADAKAAAELKVKQDAEAKAAAELKAKQEADARAAAELKAAGEKITSDAKTEAARILAAAKAAAAKEIITITCVKGKLIKKVTAIKPVCPVGYKKK
jgi:M6 family metalloprotease-like protein